MIHLLRIFSALAILVAVLVVAAFVPVWQNDDTEQALLPPVILPPMNRIAYVGPNGIVRTVTPDNSDEQQISPTDGFFTWPTWSPNAKQIVYSGVSRDTSGLPNISLFSYDVAEQISREIYVGEPGVATLLANGVVHYPLWSPDSSQLAFVAGTTQGLTLFIDDLGDNPDATRVLDNGPLWMSWSPDSHSLLVHRGPEHFLIQATVSPQVSNLHVNAGGYRVPAWNPDGSKITIASDEGSRGFTLMEALADGNSVGVPQATMDMLESPVFLWSPDGSYLALANGTRVLFYQNLSLLIHQDLTLFPSDETDEAIEIPGTLIAYFWSPDASKLAYVALSERQGVLRWMIYDVEENSSWPLVDFVPSVDQLTMFQFFDQYAYSHSLWSPNSNAIVFSGTLNSEAVTASTNQPAPNVIVIETARNSLPRVLTDGILAFWSPR